MNKKYGFVALPEQYGGYFLWDVAITGSGMDYSGNTVSSTGSDGSVCPANWRMPTSQDIADLIGYTGTITGDHTGTVGYNNGRQLTVNNIKGFAFDGTDGTLFFPYAGYHGGYESGTYGLYWLSTEYGAENAYHLGVTSGNFHGHLGWGHKSNVRPVRCVKSAS